MVNFWGTLEVWQTISLYNFDFWVRFSSLQPKFEEPYKINQGIYIYITVRCETLHELVESERKTEIKGKTLCIKLQECNERNR